MYDITAIIPARGNSERLPNKNLLPLANKPLIAHSIDFAKQNGIEKIIVSTDSEKIADTASKYGAEVIIRPKELATSTSPTIETLKHVVDKLNRVTRQIVLLQPTNPLRPQNLLKNCLKDFFDGSYDSLMTVTRNHQKFGKIIDEKFVPFNYALGQRSQDLEPLFFENGLIYITKTELIKQGKILGENNCPFIVNHPFALVDIDTQEDFDYAEYLYNKHNK